MGETNQEINLDAKEDDEFGKEKSTKKTLKKDNGEENFEWIYTHPWNGVKILSEPKVRKKPSLTFLQTSKWDINY